MATLSYWNTSDFTKRVNSTKIPGTASGSLFVTLKDGGSLLEPVFKLAGNYNDVSYCYFEGRYYYVTDIVRPSNAITEIHCKADPLATYRDSILSSSAFIEYSTSATNTNIRDPRVTITSEVGTESNSVEVIDSGVSGSYVLTVASSDSSGTGMSASYQITDSNLSIVKQALYNNDVDASISRLFNSPYESIIECHWVPWSCSGTESTIYIGNGTFTSGGSTATGLKLTQIVNDPEINDIYTVSIPKHFGDWRDTEPVSTYLLHLPYYGAITIDAAKLYDHNNIFVATIADSISGMLVYRIYTGTTTTQDSLMLEVSVDCKVDLPISQRATNTLSGIAGVAGGLTAVGAAAATFATGGAAAPALVAGLGGISSMAMGGVSIFTPDVNVKGGLPNMRKFIDILTSTSGYYTRCLNLVQLYHETSQDLDSSLYAALYGAPYFATSSFSVLGTGSYVKCAGASVAIPGTYREAEEINTYLNQGCYLE